MINAGNELNSNDSNELNSNDSNVLNSNDSNVLNSKQDMLDKMFDHLIDYDDDDDDYNPDGANTSDDSSDNDTVQQISNRNKRVRPTNNKENKANTSSADRLSRRVLRMKRAIGKQFKNIDEGIVNCRQEILRKVDYMDTSISYMGKQLNNVSKILKQAIPKKYTQPCDTDIDKYISMLQLSSYDKLRNAILNVLNEMSHRYSLEWDKFGMSEKDGNGNQIENFADTKYFQDLELAYKIARDTWREDVPANQIDVFNCKTDFKHVRKILSNYFSLCRTNLDERNQDLL